MLGCTARAGSGALIVSMLALLLASRAVAQTDEELEHARALFAEGVELTHQEQWTEAADRFRQVLAVRATAQVKYNLALALEHTGELAEASRLLGEAIESGELDRRTRRGATRLRDSIEPRLAHLTIHMSGDEAGAEVVLDGETLGLDRIGQPMAVDPGAHHVALRRGEREVASRDVSLEEGQSGELTLVETAVHASLDEELLAASREQEEPAPAGGSVLEEWWFWTIIGAVIVAGAGIAIGVAVGSQPPSPVQGNLDPGFLRVTLP